MCMWSYLRVCLRTIISVRSGISESAKLSVIWSSPETIYRGPSFLAAVWFGSTPAPPSSPFSSWTATHRKTEKERQLADRKRGKGAGVEPNPKTARKPGLKSFNLLKSSRFSDIQYRERIGSACALLYTYTPPHIFHSSWCGLCFTHCLVCIDPLYCSLG